MMKKLVIILAAAAVLLSCRQKSAEATMLQGSIKGLDLSQVEVMVGEDVDEVITVENGSFSMAVPVDLTQVGVIIAGSQQVPFVSDGTTLTALLSSDPTESTVKSSSNTSVNDKFYAYVDSENAFWERYESEMSRISQSASSFSAAEQAEREQELNDRATAEYRDLLLKVLDENKDNVLGLIPLQSLQSNLGLGPMQVDSIINTLSPALQETDMIKEMKEGLGSKLSTAEGQKFTDFTIVQDPSNPGKSTVKLSDYVGKGKYILVDFWASWCGPCRAEMPNLKDTYARFHGKSFDMLSVAVWDEPADTKKAAKELGIPWNQIINAQKIPTELYGIDGIPHIILFGPDGTILKRNLRGKDIPRTIAKYLEK